MLWGEPGRVHSGFVVCGLGLWAWWFGASGCFAMGTRACGTVEMPATRDGPLPRSQPGAPALSSSPRHSSLFISFRGPNGPCRTARKALPTPACQRRARCHPVTPTAGVPATPGPAAARKALGAGFSFSGLKAGALLHSARSVRASLLGPGSGFQTAVGRILRWPYGR